jgi:hypothetical protein
MIIFGSGCNWPGNLTDVWTGETISIQHHTGVVVDHLPWHATRFLVVEVVCILEAKLAIEPTLMLSPTVFVWWKPKSPATIARAIQLMQTSLAATDLLVYCGYDCENAVI